MARTKGSRKIGGKHLQHTEKFIKELNSVKNTPIQPFRYYDEVWIIGKYKNTSLSKTPKSYIIWAYSNMNLSDTSKSILKKYFI